mmetsp:Transcript_4130/g.9098  ORF Transcript_4130/g.9098 Transcript_4130/m.9098 type:complete len:382 (-) Transcript_4130:8-1153(-)
MPNYNLVLPPSFHSDVSTYLRSDCSTSSHSKQSSGQRSHNSSASSSTNHNISPNTSRIHKRMDNREFDLHQDYHAAIECVVQCEFIIKSLQEQLNSKDECISSLEEKLVAMSLELALAKASEDEHRLLKRKLNRAGDNDRNQGHVDNVNNIMMSEASSPVQQQQDTYNKAKSELYVPIRKNSKDMKEEEEEGVVSSPKITNMPHHTQESMSSPTPADRRRGFRMSSLRSWEIENMSNNNDSGSGGVTSSATTNSGSTSRNTSFSSLNQNGGAKHKRQTSWNGLLNDASRLSSLGHFLLGSNSSIHTGSRGEGEHQTVVDLNDVVMRSLPERGVHHQQQQDCCSAIDGVVFPVSSAEVLAGCLSEDEDCSPQHVNDEWPQFK